jgi:hypothetical protein
MQTKPCGRWKEEIAAHVGVHDDGNEADECFITATYSLRNQKIKNGSTVLSA